MLDFSSQYTHTNFVVLEDNYRSTQAILDLSSILIDNNNERLSKKIAHINKKLTAKSDNKKLLNKPKLFKASNNIEEQNFVLENIKAKQAE